MDGVMEAPGGEEGYKHTAWTFEFPDKGQYEVKTKETDEAEVMLLGRVTYEGFAAAWPEREQADDEATAVFAKRFNSMPKYVVSTTLEEATWQNTTILRSLDDVVRLKDEVEGDILLHGSNTLVQGLLERDLVDVLRLMIFPVILGIGKRIFPGRPRRQDRVRPDRPPAVRLDRRPRLHTPGAVGRILVALAVRSP